MRQVEAHECIARLEHRHKHSHVGLRTRVRLHIGILCTKKAFQTVDGKIFGLVHHFTTAIIAVSGITLCIFVGKTRAHCTHHLVAYKVLRGN